MERRDERLDRIGRTEIRSRWRDHEVQYDILACPHAASASNVKQHWGAPAMMVSLLGGSDCEVHAASAAGSTDAAGT